VPSDRRDLDDEPDEWKTALPMRSPVPLVILLAAVQLMVLGILIVYGIAEAKSPQVPFNSYQRR
jgi:hypothetical protein